MKFFVGNENPKTQNLKTATIGENVQILGNLWKSGNG